MQYKLPPPRPISTRLTSAKNSTLFWTPPSFWKQQFHSTRLMLAENHGSPSSVELLVEAFHYAALASTPDSYTFQYCTWLLDHFKSLLEQLYRDEFAIPSAINVVLFSINRLRNQINALTATSYEYRRGKIAAPTLPLIVNTNQKISRSTV